LPPAFLFKIRRKRALRAIKQRTLTRQSKGGVEALRLRERSAQGVSAEEQRRRGTNNNISKYIQNK